MPTTMQIKLNIYALAISSTKLSRSLL